MHNRDALFCAYKNQKKRGEFKQMAYQRYQGYQYETSPRKLQPEYEPKKNPYKKKKSSVSKKQTTNKKVSKNPVSKKKNKYKKSFYHVCYYY